MAAQRGIGAARLAMGAPQVPQALFLKEEGWSCDKPREGSESRSRGRVIPKVSDRVPCPRSIKGCLRAMCPFLPP
jgi:hypothetical protein